MKLKGRLKSYTQTSLYLGFLLVAVNLLVYILDVPSGTRPYLLYPFLFWDYSIAAAL